MGKMNTYQRYAIIVAVAFVAIYFVVLFFFPIGIDSGYIPTLINGVTTSIGIIVGIGGATMGLAFRRDIEKGDFRGRKVYMYALFLFLFALLYPWGSYLFLALGITGLDVFALRYSLGGYLMAMMALLEAFLLIARRWDNEREHEKSES